METSNFISLKYEYFFYKNCKIFIAIKVKTVK